MKTLYIECNMGAAGDMLLAALLELLPDPDSFIAELNHLGIPGVHIEKTPAVKCGITGTHVSVWVKGEEEESIDVPHHGHEAHQHHHDHSDDHGEHRHDHGHTHEVHDHHHRHEHSHVHQHGGGHHHSGMSEIGHIISHLPVSDQVKADALAVYGLIAEAESRAHGKPVSQVHFHEVGAMDAVTDIVGISLLMERIAPDRVVVSPIHVGSGQVKCAHGILPVPAPATAHILQGVPSYSGNVRGELCTPTGAAVLKHFADSFGPMPVMAVEKIGYGMGKKEFEVANCVRLFLGEEQVSCEGPNGEIAELSCNLDDMTGEAIGFASEMLFAHGALDVFTVPITMKKSRPGQMLVCLCQTADADSMARLILQHTTTFGLRKTIHQRYMLDRSFATVETTYGPVQVKTGTGYGVTKSKPEYEDVAKVAKEAGVPLAAVHEAVIKN